MAHEGPGRLQEPVQGAPDVVLRLRVGQVALDVVYRALEDVEVVAELVQLVAGHHQLGLAQTELRRPPPGLVRQLPAAVATPDPPPSGPRRPGG